MANTIVVFSTKGGVGNTLIAANLGVSLARSLGQRVLLVDLDVQGAGDMARMLDVRPQKAMVDLVYLLKKQPDAKFKKEDFIAKSASGPDFLAAVLKPQQAAHLEAEKIKEVFCALDKDYDYIIVDIGKNFSDIFVATLNLANLILMVVTPDILSIYQTKWALDTLQFLHFPLVMVKIILNRAESLSSISWQEVRANLPVEIIAQIPSEGKVMGQAVNRGIPAVIDNPRSRAVISLEKLSDMD